AVKAPKPAEKSDDPFEEEQVDPATVPDWPRWLYLVSDTAYAVLPRTRDLDNLSAEWVAHGVLNQSDIKAMKLENATRPSWAETLGVTAAFIAVMLGLACWRFARTDY